MKTTLDKLNKNQTGETLEIRLSEKTAISFCLIPAGSFKMGSPEHEDGRYKKEHDRGTLNFRTEDQTEVSFSHPFWMAKTPVTQEQWKAVTGVSKGRFKGADRPVEGICYLDVLEFLSILTQQHDLPAGWEFAVPTEAQWEYACRAGERGPYSGGSLEELAWYEDNSGGRTNKVGQKKPNAWGLHDMHGNVKEMCWINGLHRKGTNPMGHNPQDPYDRHCNLISLRGGSWNSSAIACRAADRRSRTNMIDKGNAKLSVYGFRIAIVPRIEGQVGIAADEQDWSDARGANEAKIEELMLPHKAGDSLFLYTPNDWHITFQYIPSGRFIMGSPADEEGRNSDENQVEVSISRPFWLAKGPLDQISWQAVKGTNPSDIKGGQLPVVCVSWEDAQNYINELNTNMPLPDGWKFALPTEAQWEYACRAGDQGPYSGGDLDRVCWYDANSEECLHEAIGYKFSNTWGLYNMHGNVWEWCADWYGDKLSGGIDPLGPASGEWRVQRGGSAFSGEHSCRAATRDRSEPDGSSYEAGFRVAIVQSN